MYGDETLIKVDALGVDFQLAEVWQRLSRGGFEIERTFSSQGRLYAVLRFKRLPRKRSFEYIERVLSGERAKLVAIETGITESTVSTSIRYALKWVGLDEDSRRVPHLVVMAIRAHRLGEPRRGRQVLLPDNTWLVSTERPAMPLLELLTAAERRTTLEYLQGKTHQEIAAACGIAVSTVRNQVGAAFRRLKAYGYTELLARLLALEPQSTIEPELPTARAS